MRRFLPHEMFYFVMYFKDMNRRRWVIQVLTGPACLRGLILSQHFMVVIDQRIGHPAHHAAFRGKTVPVEHPALEQARREVNQFAAVQLSLNLQMRDHTAGCSLAGQLHKGFRGVQ